MLVCLNPGVSNVVNGHVEANLLCGLFDFPRQLLHTKLFGELVVNAELPGRRGVHAGDLDTSHRISNIQEAACLPAAAIDGKRMADRSLGAEPV